MRLLLLVVLSGCVFQEAERPPHIAFDADHDAGTLTVTSVSYERMLNWGELMVQGCTAPTGSVRAGDELTCAGRVLIAHRATESLLYSDTFPI